MPALNCFVYCKYVDWKKQKYEAKVAVCRGQNTLWYKTVKTSWGKHFFTFLCGSHYFKTNAKTTQKKEIREQTLHVDDFIILYI